MSKKFSAKTIHLQETGVAKVLGELESRVMEYVWKNNTSTVREVCDYICKKYKCMSFNTVMTIMNRLVEKGILKKHRSDKVYIYEAVVTKNDFTNHIVSDMLSSVIKDSELFASANFNSISKHMSPAVKKKLKAFLEDDQL